MFRRSLLQCIVLAFAFSLCSPAFALDYGDVTAIRDRTNSSQLILTINLKSVTASDNSALGISLVQADQVQQSFANNFDICIAPPGSTQTSCGETDIKVKYAVGRLPVPQTGIYISETQLATFVNNGTTVITDVQDPTINSYSSQILISDSAGEIPVGSKVLLRLFPDKLSSNANKDKNDVVAKLGSGVQDAVDAVGAFPTPVSLIASWTPKATVTFVDGSTGAPNGIIGLLIPNAQDAATATFPAHTYVDDPIATPPATVQCSVTTEGLDTGNPTCSVACTPNDKPVTFDIDALAAANLRTSTTNNLANSSLGFGDLSVAGGPYAIILQYLPEGTAFSCVVGSPSDAATLIQLSGGPTPKSGDPSCFIATAAYGSVLDPHIDVLRWFRDTYLLESSWGRGFVRYYYRHSPPIADWIARHSWARTATRAALWAPVLSLEMLRDHRWMAITALLTLGIGIAFLMRRRLA